MGAAGGGETGAGPVGTASGVGIGSFSGSNCPSLTGSFAARSRRRASTPSRSESALAAGAPPEGAGPVETLSSPGFVWLGAAAAKSFAYVRMYGLSEEPSGISKVYLFATYKKEMPHA
jgi:hypothetical protein